MNIVLTAEGWTKAEIIPWPARSDKRSQDLVNSPKKGTDTLASIILPTVGPQHGSEDHQVEKRRGQQYRRRPSIYELPLISLLLAYPSVIWVCNRLGGVKIDPYFKKVKTVLE